MKTKVIYNRQFFFLVKKSLFEKISGSLILTLICCQTASAQLGGALNASYNTNPNPVTGTKNCGFGCFALLANTTGTINTATGWNSLFKNTTGIGNTATGANALLTNTSGSNNTAIGNGADVSSGTLSNATAIGSGAIVTANNTIQLGNSSVTQIFSGTGTSATFITGGLQVTGGTPGLGKVLTSNATGVATWQTPSGGGSGWSLLGNAGTVDGTNFIGTTDNIPFSIRVNNSKAGRIDHLLGNTFFGYLSAGNTTGSFNTAYGKSALSVNTTGSNNTALGYGADMGANNLTNATALGSGAIATTNNAIQLGNSTVTQIFAGTGTNASVITGGLQVSGGTPGLGKVLTSDAVGVATWQNPGVFGTNWTITGNAGTVDGTNFIGTTDNVPFNIRVNNQISGRIDIVSGNTFFGYRAGSSNVASPTSGVANTTFGYWALLNNVSGSSNTAFGYGALYNTKSDLNTAFGASALSSNTTGTTNVGVGPSALCFNSSGSSNISIGCGSLLSNTIGNYNTALGENTNVSANNLNDAAAIGYNAVVNTSDKIRLGAPTVTCVEGPVGFTTSDARFKTNIKGGDVKGLDFIKRLRPVVYNFDTRKFEEFLTKNMPDSISKRYLKANFAPSTAIRQSGFIAQEVEVAAKDAGYDFNGLHKPNDDNDYYTLAYAEFVVPLVKGMQEQQKMIEDLQQQLAEQKQITAALQNKTGASTGIDPLSSALSGFSMSQNEPNPFTHETVVKYVLPQQINTAYMAVYDLTGKQVTSFPLPEKGAASITITSERLAAGIYIYSIIGDGKVLDSKRMVVAQGN